MIVGNTQTDRSFCQLTKCWVRKDGNSVPMPWEILPNGVDTLLDVLHWNIVREQREKTYD